MMVTYLVYNSAAKSTRPARPAPNPIFDPEGEPDTPLFAPLRYQPDSTRFLAPRIGFNPIQPYPTRQPKIISFSFYCVVFVFPRISKWFIVSLRLFIHISSMPTVFELQNLSEQHRASNLCDYPAHSMYKY